MGDPVDLTRTSLFSPVANDFLDTVLNVLDHFTRVLWSSKHSLALVL